MKFQDLTYYKVRLLNGQGNHYSNQGISLNINGIVYLEITDNNGYSKLKISLNPNHYIIIATYNGYSISNNIIVNS